jgi:hypothetical protein
MTALREAPTLILAAGMAGAHDPLEIERSRNVIDVLIDDHRRFG